jgi:hypothetical protein
VRIRALVVLSVGILGLFTAGCDDGSPARLLNVATTSFAPDGRFSPNPIALTPFTNAGCRDGFGFGSGFHLVITAGVHDLTLDHVTIHMLDGTNLGGPSITIPQSDFAAQSASLFIVAGTTRDFVVRPDFGCVTTRPRSLRGNVFLLDPSGMMQTIAFDGTVQ